MRPSLGCEKGAGRALRGGKHASFLPPRSPPPPASVLTQERQGEAVPADLRAPLCQPILLTRINQRKKRKRGRSQVGRKNKLHSRDFPRLSPRLGSPPPAPQPVPSPSRSRRAEKGGAGTAKRRAPLLDIGEPSPPALFLQPLVPSTTPDKRNKEECSLRSKQAPAPC